MYPPLGILSIATTLKNNLRDRIEITVRDEDIEDLEPDSLGQFDLIGFYATTFNYATCVKYATAAKTSGSLTLLGGPHPSVLSDVIVRNQDCFDFVVQYEAEVPVLRLVTYLLDEDRHTIEDVPNLVHKGCDGFIRNAGQHDNRLEDVPIPSREFVPVESYIENFRKIYPDKKGIRPSSIYSSKGCSWRDKTGGCVFCARLEKGVRYRDVGQIWEEIGMLAGEYGINSIWDISDDNLNNKQWFKDFVESRPRGLEDLSFFIYSRVNFIRPDVIDHCKTLNVEEVFLGVESGDNTILKNTFKGQTAKSALEAATLFAKNDIRYFPSFVLGLPGETESSLANTYNLCKQMADLGGIDRLGCTILQPIPGSPAFDMLLGDPELGPELKEADDIDLFDLERRWVEKFTHLDHATVIGYRNRINELMKDYMVFGGTGNGKT
jgi:radical SAM superfamily enzyme YgiQ (UPF0313 family)